MAAYAEGLGVLHRANAGTERPRASAEIAPLRLWRRGSVIASWLLDLTAAALTRDPSLEGLAGRVSDSGEGRWTLHAAIDEGVPVPVLSAALYERFSSRGEAHFADQLLSALSQQFGGHHELAASS
jgi:6-phosphogluconate dehydrogenase